MAGYGEWIATSLKDPDAAVASPPLNRTPATAAEAIAQATAIAHMRGQKEAIALLEAAEKRFPDDASLPAMRASLAFELDQRETVRAALDRARALDPDDPTYLVTNARFRVGVSSDLDGALADLKRAAEVSPGDDSVWNEIGIVQSDRNAPIEANAAHRRAVDLNPENAAIRANYARFLMDNEQMTAARREIDAAEALDPTSYAVLAAKGRYLLRMGRTAEGETALQEAAAVNPTDGDALIGLAIANYQAGADGEAAQALDNADRFDPDNPTIALMRAGIASDQYRADDAIVYAREALRRRQARGGYYTGYDANRQVSAVLGSTLESIGLSEWSQYYQDRAFDPFLASSHDGEQRAGRANPFVAEPLSGLDRFPSGGIYLPTNLQSLILDPLAVASEDRVNSLERRKFFETSLTGGLTAEGGGIGWMGDVTLQGTNYDGLPLSYNLQAQISRPEGARLNDDADFEGGVFELGLKPTVADNVYLLGMLNKSFTGYPGPAFFPTLDDTVKGKGDMLGLGWSHTIGDRNVVQAFGMLEHSDSTSDYEDTCTLGPCRIVEHVNTDRKSFGVSHLIGLGPVTLRYGVEAVTYDSVVDGVITDIATLFPTPYGDLVKGRAERLYADGILDISNDLKLQAGAYYSRFDSSGGVFDTVDPRIGVAWAPVENHWLRAYYRRDTQFPVTQTLSPVSTVGLTPLDLPLLTEGQSRTAAVRWDAEWNERFFTSLEYQHVRFDDTIADVPDYLNRWFYIGEGRIDRVSLAANYWAGNGLGLFGSFTWNESADTTPGNGGTMSAPLIPDYVAQAGFTFVHPSRWTLSVAQTFVGERVGGRLFGAGPPTVFKLDDYTTTDISAGWKSESGHLEIALQLLNAFDTKIEMARGMPATGRTFLATMRARF